MLKFIRKLIRALAYAVVDSPTPSLSTHENELAAELKKEFTCLKKKLMDVSDSSAHSQWGENLIQLQEHMENDDIASFLRWDVITHTMFATNSPYVFKELKYLRESTKWKTKWTPAIIESKTGHPIPFITYPKSSGNLIHQVYSIAQFEEKSGVDVANLDFILEFGGGYGLMCKVIHSLGFKGKYIIFDLPQFSLLQKYYLRSLDINVVSNFDNDESGVVCTPSLDELTAHNKNSKSEADDSLFLANWSLSESPLAIRESIKPLLSSFSNMLIAYQSSFRGLDNVEYFNQFKKEFADMDWHNWIIPHQGENRYLVGSKS